MATYVFVPGGGWGGFIWRPVTSLLQAQGHEVFTPTLTGLGERAHLASPHIDLDTHLQDIICVLTYEELHDVILVGHSYGGMVITGVAERVPEEIAHLVYLDGVVPQDGQSDLDVLGPTLAAEFEAWAASHGDGWCLPPSSGASAKLTAHPLKPLKQPLSVKNPAARIPHTFIYCTASGLDSIARPSCRRWTKSNVWHLHHIISSRSILLTPREKASYLRYRKISAGISLSAPQVALHS